MASPNRSANNDDVSSSPSPESPVDPALLPDPFAWLGPDRQKAVLAVVVPNRVVVLPPPLRQKEDELLRVASSCWHREAMCIPLPDGGKLVDRPDLALAFLLNVFSTRGSLNPELNNVWTTMPNWQHELASRVQAAWVQEFASFSVPPSFATRLVKNCFERLGGKQRRSQSARRRAAEAQAESELRLAKMEEDRRRKEEEEREQQRRRDEQRDEDRREQRRRWEIEREDRQHEREEKREERQQSQQVLNLLMIRFLGGMDTHLHHVPQQPQYPLPQLPQQAVSQPLPQQPMPQPLPQPVSQPVPQYPASQSVNARPHAWHVVRCRLFSRRHTARMIKVVVALDAMTPIPQTDFVVLGDGNIEGLTEVTDVTSVYGEVLTFLEQHKIRLEGRNSTKRALAAPAFKPNILQYEKDCSRFVGALLVLPFGRGDPGRLPPPSQRRNAP